MLKHECERFLVSYWKAKIKNALQYRLLTVAPYFLQSLKNLLAENFVLITEVAPVSIVCPIPRIPPLE